MRTPNIKHMQALSEERRHRLNQLGMPVTVRLDNGQTMDSTIRGLPWQLGHGAWVVAIEGIRGGYDVLRVEPKLQEAKAA